MLCVGLDPEPARFPGLARRRGAHLRLLRRHRRRHQGPGLRLQAADRLLRRAPRRGPARAADRPHPCRGAQVPVILDAKRGDIGATAEQYAREAFERYQADAVTLSPFMGFDSIEPYLRYAGKGLILLCRTSNPGGSDLQAQRWPTAASCCTSTSRAGRRPLEPQRPARPGGGRHLPARDRARARAGAHAAAADPRRRRAGR
jgi:orotidine-5'-phosphate decarboxylase